ncbi:hypothetical protein DAMA08_027140 [Martiniozyma asiatica (nom. inval.)]|nr:hypothetical protein DAMA08_027140 [Martiniozyma asiatica]
MKFFQLTVLASAASAATSFLTSTEFETISSCAPDVTDCPFANTTSIIPTFAGAGATQGYYAAGAVALAAGALLM